MVTGSSEEQFQKGLLFLKNNDLDKAVRAFERAYQEDRENAQYMSYYGMGAALRWGEIGLGLELCTRAVKKEFYKPEYYINLGRVYLKTGNKKGAITVFKKGLRFDPENDIILEELEKIGERKRPVLRFLRRSSMVNRFLGVVFRKALPNLIERIMRRRKPIKNI